MTATTPHKKTAGRQTKPQARSRSKPSAKRRVGRPRSGKVSFTTTIRPELKQYAAEIGMRTTANGKTVPDVSAGIERALEFYRQQRVNDKQAVDANGWPIGFFEATAGRWAGAPLVREPQGEYEVRDELL